MVLGVLAEYGVTGALRDRSIDQTEIAFLLPREEFEAADTERMRLALAAVLPHKKIWVLALTPDWETEPI